MTAPDSAWQAWHFGIGDPTPIGWFTVVAYAAAAFVCWRVYVTAGTARRARSRMRFWLLLSLALAALGINKQLDLQTALTDVVRSLAYAQGWYPQRGKVQFAFIVAVAASGTIALIVMGWLSLPLSTGRLLALAGTIFLFSFVLIRASSFHHVDVFLAQTALGLRWNWILELSGIALAGSGAVAELRTRRGHTR